MSKRDELAAVLGEHCYQGFDPYVNMGDGPGDQPLVGLCACGWAFDVPADGAGDVAIWAAHQADAVLAWLGEQFDEGLRVAVASEVFGNTIGDPAKGEPMVRERREIPDIIRDADAALAVVRERLGLSDAAQDAQDWAAWPGSVRMGTGEGAAPDGAQIEDFEGER